MNSFIFEAESSEVQVLKSVGVLHLPVKGFKGNVIHANIYSCPDFENVDLENPDFEDAEYTYYETIDDEAFNGDDSLFEKVSIDSLVKNINNYCLKCIGFVNVTFSKTRPFDGVTSLDKFTGFLKMVDARIEPGFNYEDFKILSLDAFDAKLLIDAFYIRFAFESCEEFIALEDKMNNVLTASRFNDDFTSENLREIIVKRLIKRSETLVEVDGLFNYFDFTSETIFDDLMKDVHSVIVSYDFIPSLGSFPGENLNWWLKIYLNPVNLKPNFMSMPLLEFIEFQALMSNNKNFVSKETVISPVINDSFAPIRAEQSMAVINSIPSEDDLNTMFKLYDLDNETMSNLKKLFEIVTLI